MRNRRTFGLMLVVVTGLVFLSSVAGAAPWDSLFSLNRVEADAQKTYKLTEDVGPWMILAATFSGDGAEDQAHDLVLELRQRYKLPAYVHKMRFDFDNDPGGRGLNEFGQPMKWTYRRGEEIEEIAVLVGEFEGVEDHDAQKTLKQIKFAQPDCLDLKKNKRTNQSLAGWRDLQKQMYKKLSGRDAAREQKGPMGHAFLVPNPLRKTQSFNRGVDTLVVKMNEGVEHSLLDCPGRYTVQVAHFVGKVVVDQEEIDEIKKGQRRMPESKLHKAADLAHRLTVALREQGYEAYEFHDRKSSIVTVGSFDSVGTPRPDGKIEIDPTIHRIIETFKGKQPP
ncbi:MAG TPA: hypothetical protein VJL29_07640, partial [Thermoguttaceae bacterium]|nr:hypothetical protein [Thermoguttaceae bacterium]